jgi:hypothetical protein
MDNNDDGDAWFKKYHDRLSASDKWDQFCALGAAEQKNIFVSLLSVIEHTCFSLNKTMRRSSDARSKTKMQGTADKERRRFCCEHEPGYRCQDLQRLSGRGQGFVRLSRHAGAQALCRCDAHHH